MNISLMPVNPSWMFKVKCLISEQFLVIASLSLISYLNPTDLKFCVHCHSIHSEIILLMVDHGPNIQYFWISPDYLEQHLSRNEREGKGGGGENVFKNLTEPQSYVLYPCSMFKRSIN